MSTYRFLQDAYVNGAYYPAGTTASTGDVGGTLPVQWVPSGNVDPIDTAAISDFYAAGYQQLGLVRTQFTDNPVLMPATYWVVPPPRNLGPIFPPQPPPWGLESKPMPAPYVTTDFVSGAVGLYPGASVIGPSNAEIFNPFQSANFTKGVLSFWLNWDCTDTFSMDSVKINQRQVVDILDDSPMDCLAQRQSFSGSAIQQRVMPNFGCVSLAADPINMILRLRGSDGTPLVGVTVPYTPGYNSPNIQYGAAWLFNGTLAFNGGQALPFTFNGQTYTAAPMDPPNMYGVAPDCGGPLAKKYQQGDTHLYQQVCQFNYGQIPTPGVPPHGINSFASEGPTTYELVNGIDLQGNSWFVTSTVLPGTMDPLLGWHHYIFSWDTSQLVTDVNGASCTRVQCAIDRGGGINGGPLYDTLFGYPGTQPFATQLEQTGVTGAFALAADDIWQFEAPSDTTASFAYCYLGVRTASQPFFDLTDPNNLNVFISTDLGAQNLFREASKVPMQCVWFHCGDANYPVVGAGQQFLYNRANDDLWVVDQGPSGGIVTVVGPPLASNV